MVSAEDLDDLTLAETRSEILLRKFEDLLDRQAQKRKLRTWFVILHGIRH
jgi:hypothetical protein